MKKVISIIFSFYFYFFSGSLMLVVAYKYVNPPITPLMITRLFEGIGIFKSWKSYDETSPNLYRAILSSEDARFMKHEGIDWTAVENAEKFNEKKKGKKVRGASTVTMQTAKNTFLWQGRNYIRKGLEVYFTMMIEEIWGKKRILEVYSNVVEFGTGVYGAEAGSLTHFGKSVSEINPREASLLAAVLPNPHKWLPSAPTPYILKRSNWIQGRMNSVQIPRKK